MLTSIQCWSSHNTHFRVHLPFFADESNGNDIVPAAPVIEATDSSRIDVVSELRDFRFSINDLKESLATHGQIMAKNLAQRSSDVWTTLESKETHIMKLRSELYIIQRQALITTVMNSDNDLNVRCGGVMQVWLQTSVLQKLKAGFTQWTLYTVFGMCVRASHISALLLLTLLTDPLLSVLHQCAMETHEEGDYTDEDAHLRFLTGGQVRGLDGSDTTVQHEGQGLSHMVENISNRLEKMNDLIVGFFPRRTRDGGSMGNHGREMKDGRQRGDSVSSFSSEVGFVRC